MSVKDHWSCAHECVRDAPVLYILEAHSCRLCTRRRHCGSSLLELDGRLVITTAVAMILDNIEINYDASGIAALVLLGSI